MATQPTSSIEWASDSSALKTETSSTHKQYGWGLINGIGEIPNLNEVNYWRFSVYEWINYLDLENTDRVSDIAAVNTRIDNLSSDQVSYEYSNESSGNIYNVPFATFTEYDGTASSQYTDNGLITSIVNTTNAEGTGVLSITNPNDTNDLMCTGTYFTVSGASINSAQAEAYSPVCTPARGGSDPVKGRSFNNRFKYSLTTSPSSKAFSLQVCKFDPNTGNCLLYTSPSPRDGLLSRMPSSA